MVIYTGTNGKDVELPKLTLGVLDRYSEVSACEDIREKASKMLELMKDVFGEEYLSERLGGSDVESVDLVELCNLFEGTNVAYATAMRRGSNADASADLAAAERIIDKAQMVAGALGA